MFTRTEKLRLDLPVVLPDVRDLRDRCVERLVTTLQGKPGISEAHVREDLGARSEEHTSELQSH